MFCARLLCIALACHFAKELQSVASNLHQHRVLTGFLTNVAMEFLHVRLHFCNEHQNPSNTAMNSSPGLLYYSWKRCIELHAVCYMTKKICADILMQLIFASNPKIKIVQEIISCRLLPHILALTPAVILAVTPAEPNTPECYLLLFWHSHNSQICRIVRCFSVLNNTVQT